MPFSDLEQRRRYQKIWAKEQNEKGLCRKCSRPMYMKPNGKKLAHCEIHAGMNLEERHRKYLSTRYTPPDSLLPLNLFIDLPENVVAYAAALLEGEGWISPDCRGRSKGRPWAGMKIKMTDPEPVAWMHQIFGGRHWEEAAYGKRRKAYYWGVYGRRAGAVAYVIYKYLKSNRKRSTTRLVLKVSSITGWWEKCTFDPRGIRALSIVRNAVLGWKKIGGNLQER